ncbi:MAG: hypothetical protein IJM04_04355 [Prevotella sp.]|nr:hypothetical protein [Prevotella sp.]
MNRLYGTVTGWPGLRAKDSSLGNSDSFHPIENWKGLESRKITGCGR